MRGRGRETSGRLAGQAADRLTRMARQWRPVPAPMLPSPDPNDTPADPWQSVLDDVGPAPTSPASDRWAADSDSGRLAFGPWNRSALRGLVVLVAAALAVAGWWWWSGRPRTVAMAPTLVAQGSPITGLPPTPSAAALSPTPSPPAPASAPASPSPVPGAQLPATPPVDVVPTEPPVVVHVIGLVRRPGLVELTAGARVADALEAAGGVTRRRAADSVNLARPVVDGEQIFVGPSADPAQRSATTASGAQPAAGSAASGGSTARPSDATPTAPMNLNTADPATLEALPGVGPVLADRIVMWRTANGPFRSVEELGEVSGIGDAIMAQLRPLVRV